MKKGTKIIMGTAIAIIGLGAVSSLAGHNDQSPATPTTNYSVVSADTNTAQNQTSQTIPEQTAADTAESAIEPSPEPSIEPSAEPSAEPSSEPSVEPSPEPQESSKTKLSDKIKDKISSVVDTVKDTVTDTLTDNPHNETLSIHDTGHTSNFDINIIKAYTAKTLQDPDNEFFKASAGDGQVYLILEMEVKNTSDKKQSFSSYEFTASIDDYTVDSEYLLFNPNRMDYLMGGDIMAGKKLSGYLAYEIDQNWKECELAYTEIFDDNPSFTYHFTNSDIE